MEALLHKIARVLLVVGFVTLVFSPARSQCTGGTLAGAITPTLSWQTIPCIRGGEYYAFTATAGVYYTFSFCTGGGSAAWDTQITILTNLNVPTPGGFADNDCGLQSHLWYWTPPSTGTYRVLISQSNCLANANCATLAYHRELTPYGSPGNTCGTPWVIPSLPYSQSGLTSCYYGNDYTSANTCGSQYANGEDFIMRYTSTVANECISIYTDNTFIYSGLFLMRGCPGAGGTTCVAYHEASAGEPRLFNITLPTTGVYYIIMDMNPSQPPGCTPFDITIVNCIAPGTSGSTCATSFLIPSLPFNQIGFTTCGKGNNYTNAITPFSNYMNGEDFVFRYVSPGNECISVSVTNTQPYTGFFVYDRCPSTVGAVCIAYQTSAGGNPKRRTINLVAAGTYYILVSNLPAPNCTPFNINVKRCPPACTRNTNLNNSCLTPTPVSFGMLDTVCGSVFDSFTPDTSPDLLADFCGSIENNGWFSFVADSSRVTVRIDVTDCNYGYGLQARIFQSSDCINYTPRSNCWNPLIQTNGVVQATGLTIGQTYLMMFDGYATDDCSFNAYRLHGPLPVVWNDFRASLVGPRRVQIDWSTGEEVNSLGFNVQRGRQIGKGANAHFVWESIAFEASQGAPGQGGTYQHFDNPDFTGEPWYYRIQQMDLDGVSSFTDYQQVNLEGPETPQLRSVYPNPASQNVTVEFYASKPGPVSFALYSLSGMLVKQITFDAEHQGVFDQVIDIEEFTNGLYIYAVSINGKLFKGKMNILH